MKLTILVILYIITVCYSAENSKEEQEAHNNEDLFVPTHEWQIVKRGQRIPSGLHVRTNLQTGKTEAKLVEENEKHSKKKAVAVAPSHEAQNSNQEKAGGLKFTEEELKEALKNIKDEQNPEQKSKETFRNYEELKRELEDLNLVPKSDAELLRELIVKFTKVSKAHKVDEARILPILEDIEFLVHQYDNAKEFVNLNGFKEIIYKNFNSTSVGIRRESLKLFGAAVQNNAKVQIHALETGAIGYLLRILALDTNYGVKNRGVFALGSLLRRFPLAQLKFIENAGLSVFNELLKKSIHIKLQLKIVTLVNDLIVEHEYAIQDVKNTNYLEKLKQYNQVGLKKKLSEQDWCHNLSDLLTATIEADLNDHDGIEKCLNAIVMVIDDCSMNDILSIKVTLLRLHFRYKELISQEVEGDISYYTNLLELCDQIYRYLNRKYKSEL